MSDTFALCYPNTQDWLDFRGRLHKDYMERDSHPHMDHCLAHGHFVVPRSKAEFVDFHAALPSLITETGNPIVPVPKDVLDIYRDHLLAFDRDWVRYQNAELALTIQASNLVYVDLSYEEIPLIHEDHKNIPDPKGFLKLPFDMPTVWMLRCMANTGRRFTSKKREFLLRNLIYVTSPKGNSDSWLIDADTLMYFRNHEKPRKKENLIVFHGIPWVVMVGLEKGLLKSEKLAERLTRIITGS